MSENEEKVVLPFRPEITFTIEKKTLQKFFDVLTEKIAEKLAEYLLEPCDPANQEQPTAAAGSAAETPKDDPNEPWGDEPETEGDDE